MTVLGIALVAVLLVLAGRAVHGQLPKRRRRRAMRDLLLYCNGDADLAERLMLRELEHDPEAGYTQAARRAISRLRRDKL